MTNEGTQKWHRAPGQHSDQTTVRQTRYQELAAWADEQGVRHAFDLVYYGLGSSETLIGLGNVVQELSYPEAQLTLSSWSLQPTVSELLKLSSAYRRSPQIASTYRMIPPSGSISQTKSRLKLAGADTQNRHFVLLMLITPLAGDQENSHHYKLRRSFRLWVLVQSLERLIHQQCIADGRIRDSINFILKPPHHENWALLDTLLKRADRLLDHNPSFQQYSLALSQAASQLTLTSENRGDRRFFNAVDFIANGHCSPLDSYDSRLAPKLNVETFGTREIFSPELEFNGRHYQKLELPTDTEGSEADEDSNSALFFEVDPTETPERQQLTGQSILVQSTELSHYLPWSWDKPLPPETEALNQWIERELDSAQPLTAFGAACTWLCLTLSRSLPFLLEIQIAESPEEEWAIAPDFGSVYRLVPRRHNSWRPDETTTDLVESFSDQITLEIPDKVKAVLLTACANQDATPRSIGELWDVMTNEKPETWFNRQAKEHFPRLTSAKLANARSQTVFNGSGDHSLARLIQAHPRAALPAACGYQNWDIDQVERGFDLPVSASTRSLTAGRQNLLGSLLDPLDSVLVDGIRAATAKLKEAGESDLVTYHNTLSTYCVMALYAATGCRHLKDPFESVDHFCEEPASVYLNDKSDGGIHGGRLVPVPAKAMSILKAYLRHLEGLAEKLDGSSTAFANTVRSLCHGTSSALPLFFQLDATLKWQSMSSQGLPGNSLFDWPLPPNLFRHRYAQQLSRAGVHPEIIDGWLGHAERGAASYGDTSPRCWLDDVNENQGVINRLFEALEFEIPDHHDSLPDPPRLLEKDLGDQKKTQQPFGQRERQQKRRQAISLAIRSARADIKLLIGERDLKELEERDVQNLELLMLLRENGLPHPQAAIRYSTLTKLFDKTGNIHGAGLRRRMAKMEGERSLLSDESPRALTLWPLLQSWLAETLPEVQKASLSKTQALIYAATFLQLGKRITYRRLIDDILTGTNYRLIQTKDKIFLEYNEDLDPKDWSVPVQRHAIDYKIASLLAHGFGVHTTINFEEQSCPSGLNSLVAILWSDDQPADQSLDPETVSVKMLFDRLTEIVSQVNLVQLPGVVSAALSERSPPTSPHILDYLRLSEGVVYQLPETPDDAQDPDRARSPVSRLITTAHDPEALKESAKVFFQAVHDLLDESPGQKQGSGTKTQSGSNVKGASPKERSVRLARNLESFCKEASGTVSTSIIYVGYWLAARIRQGKGRPGRKHVPYANSSLHRYLSALTVPFQGLAYDVDITQLDNDSITDLCHQMLELQRHHGRDLRYFGARLLEFMTWAQSHGVSSPLWEELDLGVVRRTVAPGLLTEQDYLQSFRQILQSEGESTDHPLFVAFVLMVAYRFGLRANEAIGLLRRDWCQSEQLIWALVQSNRNRGLKTTSSRRAIPLMFSLTEEEAQLVQRLMTRYRSKAADRTNSPILCELDGEQLNLTAVHGSIPSAIARVLKTVTGNPALSLHHARHSFYNRLAAILFGIDTPLSNAISPASERYEVMQLALGDNCSVSRRSTMALARAMGHSQAGTGFRNYNHLMTDWADSLTPLPAGRTRRLSGAIQTCDWPIRSTVPQTAPVSLFQFRPPTLSNLLGTLRLASLGVPFAQAGDEMCISPVVVEELRQMMPAISKKHRFKMIDLDSGKPQLVPGYSAPSDELIKRLSNDAWLRLMKKAEYLDGDLDAFSDALPDLPLEEIVQLVGTGGHLLMYKREQCSYVRQFLELFEVPDEQYQVVAKTRSRGEADNITPILSGAGFSVCDDPKKSKELSKYTRQDNFAWFSTGDHGGLILSTSSKSYIRNRFELSIAFIITAFLATQLKTKTQP
jgi:integrase